MFGIRLGGKADVFCGGQGIVKNVSMPESTLMKKHNSTNFHGVREAVAVKTLRVGKEGGEQQTLQICWR